MDNIVIVYGGKSTEHDVSVITACLAKGYFDGNIYSVYFDKENVGHLAPNDLTPSDHLSRKFNNKVAFLFGEGKIAVVKGRRIAKIIDVDAVVNCCHGLSGEDGTVAALCGLLNVPIVGSPITPSAIAMDKIVSKQILSAYGFPVLRGFEVKKSSASTDYSMEDCNFPIIVKPATLGSSIGVKLCNFNDELSAALTSAFMYDDRALCEEALTDFAELNCSAIRADGLVKTSAVDCPVTAHDILTFDDKYLASSNMSKPAVNQDTARLVRQMTEQIYDKLGFCGVIRVDYLLDNVTGKLYVNEINSIPGSLAYGLWEKEYKRFEFGDVLVKQAQRDFGQNQSRITTFDSSVLKASTIKKK